MPNIFSDAHPAHLPHQIKVRTLPTSTTRCRCCPPKNLSFQGCLPFVPLSSLSLTHYMPLHPSGTLSYKLFIPHIYAIELLLTFNCSDYPVLAPLRFLKADEPLRFVFSSLTSSISTKSPIMKHGCVSDSRKNLFFRVSRASLAIRSATSAPSGMVPVMSIHQLSRGHFALLLKRGMCLGPYHPHVEPFTNTLTNLTPQEPRDLHHYAQH